MESDDFVDPYVDPETGVLRNLFNARTAEDLAPLESIFVATRQVELEERPISGEPSLEQLRAIHKHLFQDVYSWAGELRTVDIRKSHAGAEPFMPVSRLEVAAGYVFGELKQEKFLRGLDREKFVERLSSFYDQVNYLHPFREGNGRTQRVMWSQVAKNAGWNIDWLTISGPENDLASRLAMESGDFSGLHAMFSRAVTPVDNPQPEGESARAARLRLSLGAGPAKPSPIERDLTQRIERGEKERE